MNLRVIPVGFFIMTDPVSVCLLVTLTVIPLPSYLSGCLEYLPIGSFSIHIFKASLSLLNLLVLSDGIGTLF